MEPLPSPELLIAGEVLADLISSEPGSNLGATNRFQRVLGGSAANVAVAFTHLGGRVALAGTVGRGPTGTFVLDALRRHGVDVRWIRQVAEPTTIAFVELGTASPAFEIVRGADRRMIGVDISGHLLDTVAAVHASAFALSRQPARRAILAMIERVREHGGLVSLDLNYEPSVWGGRSGRPVLAAAVAGADLVKASRDDLARLFGEPIEPEVGADRLRDWGARAVVVTMGRNGSYLSDGEARAHVPAETVIAIDATGAGDAFWAGVLRATLLGTTIREAVVFGTRVAGRKLAAVGPLAEDIEPAAFLGGLAAAR